MTEENKTKVKVILQDKLGVDEAEVIDTAILEDDLGADSLDRVELIMEMEKEFDITIDDGEAVTVKVVEDYYRVIDALL